MTSRSGKIDPPTFRQNLQQYFNREGTYRQDSNPSVRILNLRPWPSPTRVCCRGSPPPPSKVADAAAAGGRAEPGDGDERRRGQARRHPERCPSDGGGIGAEGPGREIGWGGIGGRCRTPPGRQAGGMRLEEREEGRAERGGKNSDAEE